MKKKSINNRRDILLLLLYSPGIHADPNEPIVGRTRLVKMLFLFREEVLPVFRKGTEISKQNFYEFFPWNFGPFSRQIYDDLTFFTLRGFIEPADTTEDTLPESAAEWEKWLSSSQTVFSEDELLDYEEQMFRLTRKGVEFTTQLYNSLTGTQRKLLRDFKKRLSLAPLRAILKYVYENYPDQIEKSQIKDVVLD